MKAPFLLASLLSSVQATKVLLPLYVYPSTWETPNPWQYIYDTIDRFPDVDFQVILNVDSGPGSGTAGYNEDWLSEVPKLNAFPNVHTFGYVHVSYGERATRHVAQDIKHWANWNTYNEANISVNGIFFDEVPNDAQKKKQKQELKRMGLFTRLAKKSFKSIPSFEVIFNPGTRVEDGLSHGYFKLADQIIVYEEFAANYTADAPLANDYVPKGKADKSIILLHDFAESGLPGATVGEWLEAFVEAGLGSVNILNYGYEQSNSSDAPASLGDVAGALTDVCPG